MRALYSFNLVINIGFIFVNLVKCEMDFTYSAGDLYRLIETDIRLSKTLTDLQRLIDSFSGHLDGYQTRSDGYSTDQIIKNPLLSYELVKRHARVLDELDESFDEFLNEIIESHKSYKKMRSSFIKPSKADIENAMEAIVRLRQTYDLNVHQLSKGKMGSRNIQGYLSEQDLIDIGIYAKESGMNANAKQFLEAGLKQLERENLHSQHIVELKKKAVNALSSLPENTGMKSDREDFRVLTEMDVIFATDSLENLNRDFERLCQMHAVKEAPVSTLKCYFDKSSSPERSISPLKIEVHHEDPQVVVIYDVLSDGEINAIESATFYKLRRSLTQMYLGGSLKAERSIIRTTSQTWIHDLGHPQFDYLSKRIESLTGYRVTGKYSAEDLQVASYRPGGHYSLHTDALHEELLKPLLEPIELIQGDRLVTFMIYLSDVEMGGNTVFPMLNVSVKPIKGSAILWSNLYPDSNIARNTLHGACPVIYGIKTIATKWIRANDQMFTRHKCKPDKSSNHFTLHE